MSKRKILSVFLLFISTLTACTTSNEPPHVSDSVSATPSYTAPPANNNDTLAAPFLKDEPYMITAQQGIVMTVGGETGDGCYSLDTYPDGTADIIYFDYSSEMCIRLSSDPNLGHDLSSTAYIPSFKGGSRCLVSGENLYVLKNGQPYTDPHVEGNDPTARLYCLNLDGSDRKTLEYGTNIVFQWDGGVAGDKNGNLYTVLLVVDSDSAKITSVLAKLGRDIEGYEALYSWEEPLSVKLVGVCDDGFVIQSQDTSSPSAPTKLILIRDQDEEQPLLDCSDLEVTSYTIYNNILYYTKNSDPNIYAQNLLDSSTSITYTPFYYQNLSPDLAMIQCEVRDNHLIIQYAYSEEQNSLFAALDLSSEEFTPLELYYGDEDNRTLVGIYAEGENDFLVCVGKFTRVRTDYGTDGTPFSFEQGFQDYVLISKSDYWNNIPNYRRFQYYD